MFCALNVSFTLTETSTCMVKKQKIYCIHTVTGILHFTSHGKNKSEDMSSKRIINKIMKKINFALLN